MTRARGWCRVALVAIPTVVLVVSVVWLGASIALGTAVAGFALAVTLAGVSR